jgi:hypothetical protein
MDLKAYTFSKLRVRALAVRDKSPLDFSEKAGSAEPG